MEIKFPWVRVHFIGISGMGMSGLAKILLQAGVKVSGSDLVESENIYDLYSLGANIFIGNHKQEHIQKNIDLVVYSSAIGIENLEFVQAKKYRIDLFKRGEFLALLCSYFSTVIGVAGSHGKSTVTTMLAYLLREKGHQPSYIIGAYAYGGLGSAQLSGDIIVVELDESDGTLVHCKTDIAVIVNIDDDHSWNHKEGDILRNFQKFAKEAKKLVILGEYSDIFTHEDKVIAGDPLSVISLNPYYQLCNIFLSLKVYEELFNQKIEESFFNGFLGLARRGIKRWKFEKYRIWEDYAHHPTEIKAFLESFDLDKTVVIFQAHRFQRLKTYYQEFIDIFIELKKVYVLPTFGAWLDDEDEEYTKNFVDSIFQATYINSKDYIIQAQEILTLLKKLDWSGDILFLGAGDIKQCLNIFLNKFQSNCLGNKIPELERQEDYFYNLNYARLGNAFVQVMKPVNTQQLQDLVKYCQLYKIDYNLLGLGANILGHDDWLDGIIINLQQGDFKAFSKAEEHIIVGGGVSLANLTKSLVSDGFDITELGGIPATVGGAIFMNAGAHGKEISEYVIEVHGVDEQGKMLSLNREECGFTYRKSNFSKNFIITQVILSIPYDDVERIKRKNKKFRKYRLDTQPIGKSCGCLFKNPRGDYAGKIIDQLGFKETENDEKSCMISREHANFCINHKSNSLRSYLSFVRLIRRRIYDNLGIILEPEFHLFSSEMNKVIYNELKRKRILVLKGGISIEREISLKTARAVGDFLLAAGHKVEEYDVFDKKLPKFDGNIDLVFPMLHGEFGEDGQVQELLEQQGLKFITSKPKVHALCLDKYKTSKKIKKDFLFFSHPKTYLIDQCEEYNGDFPVIMKGNKQGSSHTLSLVSQKEGLMEAWKKAKQIDDEVLIQEYIYGTEGSISFFMGEVLGIVEIEPKNGIFDYDSKYLDEKTKYICPSQSIPKSIQDELYKLTLELAKKWKLEDMFRLDFIYKEGRVYFLEINTIPGFTPTSLLPLVAKNKGYSFFQLVAKLTTKYD